MVFNLKYRLWYNFLISCQQSLAVKSTVFNFNYYAFITFITPFKNLVFPKIETEYLFKTQIRLKKYFKPVWF